MTPAPARHFAGVVPAGTARGWLAAIDRSAVWRERRGTGFDPWSSSLRLSASDTLAWRAVVDAVLEGPVGFECHARWGDAARLAVDACWIRRQYAPDAAPAGHAPHAWHQDGALGTRFDAPHDTAKGSLLDMLTCWIALVPCGDDAPGLELAVDDPPGHRLDLDALQRLRDAPPRATWRPRLAAGDALLFDGRVPHRTHVHAGMSRTRTSVELRFVAACRDADGDESCPRAGRLWRWS